MSETNQVFRSCFTSEQMIAGNHVTTVGAREIKQHMRHTSFLQDIDTHRISAFIAGSSSQNHAFDVLLVHQLNVPAFAIRLIVGIVEYKTPTGFMTGALNPLGERRIEIVTDIGNN